MVCLEFQGYDYDGNPIDVQKDKLEEEELELELSRLAAMESGNTVEKQAREVYFAAKRSHIRLS